jgi:hypothetical protein
MAISLKTRSTLFVVGRILPDDKRHWMFMGVFDQESSAVHACTSPLDFVGSCQLNERLPDAIEQWPGAWFPLAGAERSTA